MNAAIYTRVSTDDQAQGASIDDQEAACRAYALEHGLTVAGVYSDPGKSGALDEDGRPGLAALLVDVRQRRFTALLIWDESRLARDVHLAGHLYHLLGRAGVRVVAVSHPETTRLEGGIRRILADEQRETTREAVRRAMQSIKASGGRHGGRPIYGYRYDGTGRAARMVVEPVEAAEVRRLYDGCAQGVPIVELARTHGRAHGLVLRRLRHPAYAGGYRGPAGVVWDHHEPIVPRSTWDAVQDRLDRQAGSANLPARIGTAPLSGLLICPDCGRSMGMEGKHRQRAGVVYWYSCHTRRRIEERWIAGTLWPAVLRWADDPAIHARIAEVVNAAYLAGVKDGSLETEARSLEGRIARLTDAIGSGLVPDVRALAAQLGEAQRAVDAVRGRLAASRRAARVLLTPAAVGAALRARIASGSAPTREVLHRALEAVTVDGGGYLAHPRLEPRSYLWAPPVVYSRTFAVPVAA